MPNHWIEFSIDSAEQAVLESALSRLPPRSSDYFDLRDDEGRFVYAGDVDALGHALAAVRERHRDPAAEDVRHKLTDAVEQQENRREVTASE